MLIIEQGRNASLQFFSISLSERKIKRINQNVFLWIQFKIYSFANIQQSTSKIVSLFKKLKWKYFKTVLITVYKKINTCSKSTCAYRLQLVVAVLQTIAQIMPLYILNTTKTREVTAGTLFVPCVFQTTPTCQSVNHVIITPPPSSLTTPTPHGH